MKSTKLLFLFFAIYLTSCENQTDTASISSDDLPIYDTELMTSIVTEAYAQGPGWRNGFRKFFRSFWGMKDYTLLNTGTRNPNCEGAGDCGPCPALCLSFGLSVNNGGETDSITEVELQEGYRILELGVVQDDTTAERKLMVSIGSDYINSFVLDDYFTITEELELDSQAVDNLGLSSITLKPGRFKVTYLGGGAYTVLLNAVLQ